MIKAIIFDMDGLIINSEHVSYLGYQEVMNHKGYTIDLPFYAKLLGKKITDAYPIFEVTYGKGFPTKQVIKEVHSFIEQYFEANGVPLKKGLLELLEYLKQHNYKTIIATSSQRARAEKILGRTGANILDYFDDSICGDEVSMGKPNPEVFIKACTKLNVEPNEAFVLEDSEMGILAAYRAGIRCICIPDLKYPDPEYADKTYKIVDSLHDVITILET